MLRLLLVYLVFLFVIIVIIQSFHGATAIQSELAKYFQAVVGEAPWFEVLLLADGLSSYHKIITRYAGVCVHMHVYMIQG